MALMDTILALGKYLKCNHVKSLFCYLFMQLLNSTSFKDEVNAKVTDKLIREVKSANPAFQNGLIRGKSIKDTGYTM